MKKYLLLILLISGLFSSENDIEAKETAFINRYRDFYVANARIESDLACKNKWELKNRDLASDIGKGKLDDVLLDRFFIEACAELDITRVRMEFSYLAE